ncbi:MAG: fimbrillin family protein [Muribaculaceae bacterium]|nr:fimbrillin family protein [Muribaculaceae bacterium]
MKTASLTLLTAVAALAMVSCSEDEPLSVADSHHSIQFRPAMGNVSRAAETNNTNLAAINVAAYLNDQLYFPVLEFDKGADGVFSSSPDYYWPTDDSRLSFTAYAPVNPGGDVALDATSHVMTDFSPAASMGDQVDFITADATGYRSANEATGVELTFSHKLSQIEVLAKTDNENYTFKVSGVRIAQPVAKADYDFNADTWTLGTDKAVYEATYDTPVVLTSTAASVMGDGHSAMLIPQQLTAWDNVNDSTNTAKGAYLAVKLEVATAATGVTVYPFPSDADCQWAAIPIDTDWQPGKTYIYTLDFTHGGGYVDPHDPQPGKPVLGGPIRFTVDVADWVAENVDQTMSTSQK